MSSRARRATHCPDPGGEANPRVHGPPAQGAASHAGARIGLKCGALARRTRRGFRSDACPRLGLWGLISRTRASPNSQAQAFSRFGTEGAAVRAIWRSGAGRRARDRAGALGALKSSRSQAFPADASLPDDPHTRTLRQNAASLTYPHQQHLSRSRGYSQPASPFSALLGPTIGPHRRNHYLPRHPVQPKILVQLLVAVRDGMTGCSFGNDARQIFKMT